MDPRKAKAPISSFRIPPPPPPADEPPFEPTLAHGLSSNVNIQYFVPSAPNKPDSSHKRKKKYGEDEEESSGSPQRYSESGTSNDPYPYPGSKLFFSSASRPQRTNADSSDASEGSFRDPTPREAIEEIHTKNHQNQLMTPTSSSLMNSQPYSPQSDSIRKSFAIPMQTEIPYSLDTDDWIGQSSDMNQLTTDSSQVLSSPQLLNTTPSSTTSFSPVALRDSSLSGVSQHAPPMKSRFFSSFGVADLVDSDEDMMHQPSEVYLVNSHVLPVSNRHPPHVDTPFSSRGSYHHSPHLHHPHSHPHHPHHPQAEEEEEEEMRREGRVESDEESRKLNENVFVEGHKESHSDPSSMVVGVQSQYMLADAFSPIQVGEVRDSEAPEKQSFKAGNADRSEDIVCEGEVEQNKVKNETLEGSESGAQGNAGLKRAPRFSKENILIDKSNELYNAVKTKASEKTMLLAGEIVSILKKDRNQVSELDMPTMILTIRCMLATHESLVRCSGLRMLRYICVDQTIVLQILKAKVQLFLIMCLERSEKFLYERECALRIISYLVDKYSTLMPRSIMVSVLCIANDHTDPIHFQCLCLVRTLLTKTPDEVIKCGGILVLLNGCMKARNGSLLQTSLLTCLFYLNEYKYRQRRTMLDLQIILDPLLTDSELTQDLSAADLESSKALANLSVLTIMKSWSGIFVFGGEFGGLNNYINILNTRGYEDPNLAKDMIGVIFTLLGTPIPKMNTTNSLSTSDRASVYWTNCSLFLDRICANSQAKNPIFYSNTNLLSSYLVVVLWALVNSSLPETLAMLILNPNEEIAFLSNQLLKTMVLMSSVFSSMNDRMVRKTLKSSILSFQSGSIQSEDDMRQYSAARSCFIDIGSCSRYLYPIVEDKPRFLCRLTDVFSQYELFNSLLDCLCDDMNPYQREFAVVEYACSKDVPFQQFNVESCRAVYYNRQTFGLLLNDVLKNTQSVPEEWNWELIAQLLYVTVQKEDFIVEVFKSNFLPKLMLFFHVSDDWNWMAPHLPINCNSVIYGICFILYLMITFAADTDYYNQTRKERNIRYLYHEIFFQLEDAQRYSENGLFCPFALVYTNACIMFHVLSRLLWTARLCTILNFRNDMNAIMNIAAATDYPNSNILLIRSLLTYIDVRYPYCAQQRDCLSLFCDNGPSSIKLLCISRIRSTFREMNGNEEYAKWAIPVVLRQVAFNMSVTMLVIDTLYETTQSEVNLIVLIDSLKHMRDVDRKQILLTLTRTEAAELLIYSIMCVEEGITMIFESCDNYLANLMSKFMSHGIFDYVFKLEDDMTTGIMRNPSSFCTRLMKVDNDPTLLIKPLRVQPSSDIVYSMLRNDVHRADWLMRLPWRVEIALIEGDRTTYLDVLTQVDFGVHSNDIPLAESRNIRIRGYIVDKDLRHESSVKFPVGSELRAFLFLGSECIDTGSNCADFCSNVENYRSDKVTTSCNENGEEDGEDSTMFGLEKETNLLVDQNKKYWKYQSNSSLKRKFLAGELTAGIERVRGDTILNYMMHPDQNKGNYQEISFVELEKRIMTMFADQELNGAVFRICRENGCCAWKFTVPEGDFKLADISLGRAISLSSVEFVTDFLPHKPVPVTVGPHLFGVFFSTPSGRRLLNDYVFLSDITQIIMDPYKSLVDRRAALWAIAHIAAQAEGVEFLKGNASVDIIPAVIDIIQNDPFLSFRGSAYMALSFISSSAVTHEDITNNGWVTETNNGCNVCWPADIRKLFRSGVVTENWKVPTCDHFFAPDTKSITHHVDSHITRTTTCASDIILNNYSPHKDIIDLCKMILSLNSGVMNRGAKVSLEESKRKFPLLFQSPSVLCNVHHLLSISNFTRGWRKFVFQLFGDMEWSDEAWIEFDNAASFIHLETKQEYRPVAEQAEDIDLNEKEVVDGKGEEEEEELNGGSVVSYMNYYGLMSNVGKGSRGNLYGGNRGQDTSTEDGGSFTSFNSFNRIYGGPYPTSQSSFSEF